MNKKCWKVNKQGRKVGVERNHMLSLKEETVKGKTARTRRHHPECLHPGRRNRICKSQEAQCI
jgi:hypothetical protein